MVYIITKISGLLKYYKRHQRTPKDTKISNELTKGDKIHLSLQMYIKVCQNRPTTEAFFSLTSSYTTFFPTRKTTNIFYHYIH